MNLTEETAKQLIEAINKLTGILKPIPEETKIKELTPQQKKQQQKMAERERERREMEIRVEKSFARHAKNYEIKKRVEAENKGTATGSTSAYIEGLSHRERVYYDRIKNPYHLRGNNTTSFYKSSRQSKSKKPKKNK